MKGFIGLMVALIIGFSAPALATNSDDPCSHPVFVTHECLGSNGYDDGVDGQDGQDGRDGTNGIDGQDGRDGTNGIDGQDGVDGIDGANGTNGQNGARGATGATGATGSTGAAGRNGVDGVNGVDGKDGVNGVDGKDGVVPDYWNKQISSYIAASDAIHVFLPQDATSRFTVGAAQVNGQTGFGLGYAYRCHECERAPALTIGLGKSSGETTGRVSIGWEF